MTLIQALWDRIYRIWLKYHWQVKWISSSDVTVTAKGPDMRHLPACLCTFSV